ncbi:MAG: hypothetical protein QMD71_09400 [bacterium]|nr:hypothetical protein [bacterium]
MKNILPFVRMDEEDECQIVRSLRGEVINDFVYSFKDGDNEVTGLSIAGIENVCRQAAKIGEFFRVIGMPVVYDSGDYIEVIVKVGRFTINRDGKEVELDSAIGAKREYKFTRLPSGKIVADPFYFEKAVSKAERNGKRKLLPEKLINKLIKEYKKKGKVKQLKAKNSKVKSVAC